MRGLAAVLLCLTAIPLFAKWEACPTTCNPPTSIVSGLSRLPLYSVPVRFKEEVKSGGGVFWLFVRVNPPPACTPAQQANTDDRLFGCGAKATEVLFRSPRVRATTTRLTTLAMTTATNDAVLMVRPPWCPMLLPDSFYSDEQREQCAAYDAAIGLETGPRERRAKN